MIMSKNKPNMYNLSQGEADTISTIVKTGLDILVKLTKGKSIFGKK